MEAGESFDNYFPLYGRVLSITPQLTNSRSRIKQAVIYEVSETADNKSSQAHTEAFY